MKMKVSSFFMLLPLFGWIAEAFAPTGNKLLLKTQRHEKQAHTHWSVFMAPRFDKKDQRWYPSSEGEATEAYGPVGSLIRQGPKAFISRFTNADEYEQGVYKMMAQEGWSRLEAQGNMDAFIENPQDWMMQKAAEKKGAPKYDYGNANTNPKQIVLTLTWAAIVVTLVGRVIYINAFTEGSGNIWTG